jgi:hypothetical protein
VQVCKEHKEDGSASGEEQDGNAIIMYKEITRRKAQVREGERTSEDARTRMRAERYESILEHARISWKKNFKNLSSAALDHVAYIVQSGNILCNHCVQQPPFPPLDRSPPSPPRPPSFPVPVEKLDLERVVTNSRFITQFKLSIHTEAEPGSRTDSPKVHKPITILQRQRITFRQLTHSAPTSVSEA